MHEGIDMNRTTYLVPFLLMASLLSYVAHAQDSTEINYQGTLHSSGAPVTGTVDLLFTLWDAEEFGEELSTIQTANAVPVIDGLFQTPIDFGANIYSGDPLWLEIRVRMTGDSEYDTLTPRSLLTAAPFAVQTRGILVDEGYRVGIGLTDPTYKLDVITSNNDRAISARNIKPGSQPVAVRGEVTSNSGIAVQGVATAPDNFTTGVQGLASSTLGTGVHGWAQGTSGTNFGVWGQTNSPDGYAAYFTGSGGSKNYFQHPVGIGTQSPTSPLHINTSTHDKALNVHSTHSNGYAGYFTGSKNYFEKAVGIGEFIPGAKLEVRNDSYLYAIKAVNTTDLYESIGVFGYGTSDDHDAIGVRGKADSFADGGSSIGVLGESVRPSGVGVLGHATQFFGVSIGVEGKSNSTAGFDFYASGDGLNYGSSSSKRWKHNINNIKDPLQKLEQLRGVTFDWDQDHGGHHDIGLIAEEVGKVLPEIVNYEANGIDAIGLDYSKLSPLLVESVNALRIDHQRQLTLLRHENGVLRARLDKLELVLGMMLEQQ